MSFWFDYTCRWTDIQRDIGACLVLSSERAQKQGQTSQHQGALLVLRFWFLNNIWG